MLSSLIVDIIVVGIIIISTVLGIKKGLVKGLYHLCSFFVALIIACMLYKPVSEKVMQKTGIDEFLQKAISNVMSTSSDQSSVDVDAPIITDIPSFIMKHCENTVGGISSTFSKTIIKVACFLIISGLVQVVLAFVTFFADLIANLPILDTVNKLGGTLYGFIEGVLIVFIGLAIVSLASPFLDSSILEAINSSRFGSIFYNNNLLLQLIMSKKI